MDQYIFTQFDLGYIKIKFEIMLLKYVYLDTHSFNSSALSDVEFNVKILS